MRISEATGRTLYKHCYIFDLGGIPNCLCATHLCQVLALGCFVSRTRFEPFSMLQSITILRHSGKCGFSRKCALCDDPRFLINAPWVFRSIWMVIQPLIHEKTRVKIKLMGGNYIEEMKEHGVDPDQLPVSIGGTYEINHLAPQ